MRGFGCPDRQSRETERPITTSTVELESLSTSEFCDLVQAHLDGVASEAEVELLRARPQALIAALLRLYDDAEQALEQVTGPPAVERAHRLGVTDTEPI